jgi:hypothetical protein
MSDRIAKIKDAIVTMHGCKAAHVTSEFVIEIFQKQVAWDGMVETYDLTGHPKAKRCYAWMYAEKDVPQYTTVLELPPVDSAETAVQVAIAASAQKHYPQRP